MEKEYQAMHDACQIGMGDEVILKRTWKYGELGYRKIPGGCDKIVGAKGVVIRKRPSDYHVLFDDDSNYAVPYFALSATGNKIPVPLKFDGYSASFDASGGLHTGPRYVSRKDLETLMLIAQIRRGEVTEPAMPEIAGREVYIDNDGRITVGCQDVDYERLCEILRQSDAAIITCAREDQDTSKDV